MPNTAILSDAGKRNLIIAGICGAFVLAGGLSFASERVWSNLLVGAYGLLTIGLGGTVFLALTFLSGAGWHVAFRRVPEAMAMLVPLAGVAILFVLALRMRQYGWHHHGEGEVGAFWFKQLWLTPWFWYARSVGYVVVWSLLGGWLVSRSRAQDANPAHGTFLAGNIRLSAFFLAVYALTFSLASVDWIMSLQPMWFSTIWGIYHFAGMMLTSLAVMVIFGVRLSMQGHSLHGIFNTEHLHDLGKLLVGFSCFWMYIWFSQYMLIWYSNIPEETSYFIARTHGPWGPVVVTSIVLNWVVPFFVLLPKPSKRNAGVMVKVAVVILIGRWVDLYVMVFPSIVGHEEPVFGVWELAAICCTAVAGVTILDRSFRTTRPVPQNDPYLSESLNYHAS